MTRAERREWGFTCGVAAAKRAKAGYRGKLPYSRRDCPFLAGGHSVPAHDRGEEPRFIVTAPEMRPAWFDGYEAELEVG